jgi:pyruvate/2-oxoglutarate dehydrogenase complex dihydrolipoamide dehydrogenase (E3) component
MSPTPTQAHDEMSDTLLELAEEFQAQIEIKDRKYRLKTYKDTFVGSEAVDYLVSSGKAATRTEAVSLGQVLQVNFHLFEHVTRDHDFADDGLFFRFLTDNERGGLSRDESGNSLRWQNFLGTPDGLTNQIGLQPSFPKNDILPDKDQHVVNQVWPLDEYNRTLLNNVHPPGWRDPAVASDKDLYYDMVVIGGGTAGLITAAGSAGVGAKVALIEAHMLGGDCLNVGCVPSKTIIHSANLAHQVQNQTHLAEAGIAVEGHVTVDFEKVMERVRKIRSTISHHDSAERYSKELGVEIYIGWAMFTSERTVEVNGKTLHFKKAAIATGGYPVLLPMPGLQDIYKKAQDSGAVTNESRPQVMTNETVFNLTKRPENMVVIGAGVIGLELAQALQRLGVGVTVLGRSGRVLPKEDEDMGLVVKNQMIQDGVDFRLTVQDYKKIELTGKVLENGYPEMKLTLQEKGNYETTVLYCDAILIAAGRAPNVSGMNLEAAKVQFDKKMGVHVNDNLQTSNKRIYGVGDVCSDFKFTHAADFMARAVIRNALFFGKEKMSELLIPYATFTSPEIASVGLYEDDLKAKNIAFRVFEKHFKDNDRAIADDATDGWVRFRVDAKTDKILGASIVGVGAGNMISEVTLAMQSSTGLGSLANVIHPYPTTAEVLRQSGDLYNKTKLTMTAKKILRGVVKLQR